MEGVVDLETRTTNLESAAVHSQLLLWPRYRAPLHSVPFLAHHLPFVDLFFKLFHAFNFFVFFFLFCFLFHPFVTSSPSLFHFVKFLSYLHSFLSMFAHSCIHSIRSFSYLPIRRSMVAQSEETPVLAPNPAPDFWFWSRPGRPSLPPLRCHQICARLVCGR